MRANKQIKEEAQSLDSLMTLVEAYEEIAAIRMRKVRKSVLARREFMHGLAESFAYIIYAYRVYKKAIKDEAGIKTNRILSTNGKTVSVLLSSNTGLYGDIIRNTYNEFWKNVKTSNSDIVIVGRLGRRLFESLGDGRDFKYFEMSDKSIDEENISRLLDHVTNYSNVIVYHGVFKSILDQSAQKTFLTGEVLRIADSLEEKDAQFLFEPSIEKIAEYFEKQVLSVIFEQTMFESSLSKYASRMVSLDSAAGNIHESIDKLNFESKKVQHKKVNADLQAAVSGASLWM